MADRERLPPKTDPAAWRAHGAVLSGRRNNRHLIAQGRTYKRVQPGRIRWNYETIRTRSSVMLRQR